MGAQWKQAGRETNAMKRGQVVVKLVREITVAAKLGGADPESNARLAAALEKARKSSVTRDTIERAIKKATGQSADQESFELVTYEGFTPHKVPVIVECLTNNRNRTAPEIRHLFRTGQLGTPGSVGFFFDHVGVIEANHAEAGQDLETAAIEAGAQNVEALAAGEFPEGRAGARFITEAKDLDTVSKALLKMQWTITASEMRYLPKNPMELPEGATKEVADFLNALDDHEDVHRIYTGLK